ncbi:alpha/beta fold hydrolase [Haloactinospora alba]|uniref:alpha/beta fold hydrolase n=1 Tax=Haloactinospora alba TaxID=405555 RepID=UPI00115101D6|nr:alpha/beta fold hydrolase [Haloactinospora alba]
MSWLDVPGARLYYETSGSGPLLLLIAGGTDDARDFAGVAPLLAPHFTLVVYDCRGVSRSSATRPEHDVPIPTQADDARRILQAVGTEPAYVFGSSSGAQTGLALAACHPEHVRALVAHEPPAVGLLPDGDPRRTVLGKVRDRYRREGVGAAMETFVAGTGLRGAGDPGKQVPESPEAAVRTRERLERVERNLDFFLAHIVLPTATYLPDTTALRSCRVPVAVGAGAASEGQLAHDTALALARDLVTKPVLFAGGHTGFVTHPTSFAATLRATLRGLAP